MIRLLRARTLYSCAVAFGLFATGPVASAQICTGPDGLNPFACCQFVFPNLPAFNPVQIPGLGVCWQNCQPQSMNNLRVDWQAPVQTQCSEYVTLLTVTDANSLQPILTGKLHLSYTRTWDEADPSGGVHQVWRFAAKADLSIVPGSPALCPVPGCLPAPASQGTAFFYGYVDYTAECGTTLVQNSLVLYHACDFFIHRPGLSSRPGSFHPNQSYAIVAPHSTAQFFVPGNLIAPQGPMLPDAAVREDTNIAAAPCFSADPIFNGQIANLGGACLCIPAVVPKQHQFRTFNAQMLCPNVSGTPGTIQALSIGFPNVLPWFNMNTTSIGQWLNPNLYPGTERAWVDEGLFLMNEGCNGDVISIQYGGSTKGGWFVLHPVLFDGFLDIADNWTAPFSGPFNFPLFGNIQPTDRVIYADVP